MSVVSTLILGKFAFESYLEYRQYKVYQNTKPPASISKEVPLDKFLKSQEYSRARSKYRSVKKTFNAITDLLTINYDVLPYIWSITGKASLSLLKIPFIGRFLGGTVISQSVVFFAATTLINIVQSLPFSYYYDFVLEEKFGFNKSTKALWVKDNFKQIVLNLTLVSPAIYGFLKIIDYFGASFVSYACVFVLVAQLLLLTIVPSLILPLFYKLTPLEDGELKTKIEALAHKNGFPLADLFVLDGSTRSGHSNAIFVGLPWSKKILLFDTLIEQNTTEETLAVLAHEIGHWKLNHLPQSLLADQISVGAFLVLFSAFLENQPFFHSFGFFNTYPPFIAFTLFQYINTPVGCVTKFLSNSLTRKNEFEADKFAHDQGYSKESASALIKLATENLGSLNADWLYSAYNDSHPILADRLSNIGYVSEEKVGKLNG